MKLSKFWMALTAIFVACATANASLLVDGSFSAADSGAQTSNSPWVLAVNFPDGSDDAAQFQTGFANAQNTGVGGTEAPGTGAGVWFKSFEGNQGGSGEPLAQASLTQTATATSDGDYTLSFVAGRETNFTADSFFVSLSSSGGGVATVDLLTAAIPDGNLGGAASTNPGGTPFSATVTGVTTGDLLTVSAFMINGEDFQMPGGQSAFLDSFVLDVVPEPASLGLIGCCLFGLMLRRRR